MKNKPQKYRPQTLTQKQQDFIECYERNAGNIAKICIELKLTTGRVAQYMDNPLVKERLSRSVEIARQRIEAAAPHLVNLALQMVNDDQISPKIKASLIDSLLDRAGVEQPKTPPIQININTQIADRARAILAEKLNTPTPTPIPIESAGESGKGDPIPHTPMGIPTGITTIDLSENDRETDSNIPQQDK